MILEEIQIERFRSLKSVTWKPGRLNVLIGPNGGGKSNILAALSLLRTSADGGLRKAVLKQGGISALAWNGEDNWICLYLRATHTGDQSIFDYRLALEHVGSSGLYLIAGEKLTSGGSDLIDRNPLNSADSLETLLSTYRGVPEGRFLPIGRFVERKAADEFASFARAWAVYQGIHVEADSEIRRPAVTRFEKRVDSDGQNLIPVLHTLYESERQFEDLVDSAMSSAFVDYEKLRFPAAADGRIQLQVRKKKRIDSAANLSDGTLRFLLLLAIIGNPDPDPIIALDEPETGLHPRMMSIIASVAADASTRCQVIFTTHSPQFLDAFSKDDPPTTTVVTSNGCETELKTIGGDRLRKWVEDYSLGKFAFSGEAEAVL
ncbi:MAG TPA: AAA family ATPase [Bryobacteraceae bacterium]|nr:AAA family ATPase [Bryobacteraceae bacterium]